MCISPSLVVKNEEKKYYVQVRVYEKILKCFKKVPVHNFITRPDIRYAHSLMKNVKR